MASAIDQATTELVKNGWTKLKDRYRPGSEPGESNWTDQEGDIGFLKDVDALNALIEPFLLAPASFIDPPLPLNDFSKQLKVLLSQVVDRGGEEETASIAAGHTYRGFSAKPYPYVEAQVDFVDSAASVLRLICNGAQLFAIQKQPMSDLDGLMSAVACSAVDFLLEAKIDDHKGIRWQCVAKEVVSGKKAADAAAGNLFFTNLASLSLNRARATPTVKNWLGMDRIEKIEAAIPKVVEWVAKQYDANSNNYWLEETRQQVPQTMGVLYALEMLYTLHDDLPDDWAANAARALSSVMEKMTTSDAAAGLFTNIYYTVNLPGGVRMSYDDRRYIGAFLGLMATAKTKDRSIMNEYYTPASEALFNGLSKEWIDASWGLWDDGNALICYTQDALLALVRFAQEGRVGTVNLKETDLRAALAEVLRSDDVLEAVFSNLVEQANARRDQELVSKMKNAAKR